MSNPALENAMTTLNAQIGQSSEPTDWFEITQDRVNGLPMQRLISNGSTLTLSAQKLVRLAVPLPMVS